MTDRGSDHHAVSSVKASALIYRGARRLLLSEKLSNGNISRCKNSAGGLRRFSVLPQVIPSQTSCDL